MNLDSQSDFVDKNHLSAYGVDKFNREFLNWFLSYHNENKN